MSAGIVLLMPGLFLAWLAVPGTIPTPAAMDLTLVVDQLHDAVRGPRRAELTRLVSLSPRPAMLAGRNDLLDDLHRQLTAGDRPWPRCAALCGLGGVGKTVVAVEYAHRHLAEVGLAWQLGAEDPTLLAAGLGELAAHLGVRDNADARDPVASVHAALASHPDEWLLIFDNAPDEASVRRFLPPAGRGRVLITSQSGLWPPGQSIEIPVLDTDVAAVFLGNRTDDPDSEAAGELADEMGGLPLALEQAAAYIQATGGSLAGYLRLLRQRRADLLARGEAPGHPASVAATLTLALSRLEAEAPAAARLLRLLACLAPEPAPLAVLLPSPEAAWALDGEPGQVLGPLAGDALSLGDAIAALRRFSLVSTAKDGTVLVHRLVQVTTFTQLAPEVAEQWRHAAATLVDAAIPADTDLPETWPACAVLLPHAQVALNDDSDGIVRLAGYLGRSGTYPAARDLWRKIAHAREKRLGPAHPDTLDARASFAHMTGEAGDATTARDLFTALVPVHERVLGPEHPDTLLARSNLAGYTGRAGDPVTARDMYSELLLVRERVLGPEHPDTLTTFANIAGWTGRAGDPIVARAMYAKLLPIRERVLGSEHRQTLLTRYFLCSWAGAGTDPAAARDEYLTLIPIMKRVFGIEHPRTLAAQCDLADRVGESGDPASARDLYATLLPAIERILGPQHPDTLAARSNLAFWSETAAYASLRPVRHWRYLFGRHKRRDSRGSLSTERPDRDD